MLRLVGVVTGQGPAADVAALDDVRRRRGGRARPGLDARRIAGDRRRPGAARRPDAARRALRPRRLADLEAAPHGIDLGPLQPRLPGRAAHRRAGRSSSRRAAIVADVPRLAAALDARAARDGAHRPPPAALEQLVDAQRGARSCAASTAAPRSCTPTTPAGSGCADGDGPSCARAPARSACRSRSPTRSARRRQHPARVGPRPGRHADGGRDRARRRELQPARRRRVARRRSPATPSSTASRSRCAPA